MTAASDEAERGPLIPLILGCAGLFPLLAALRHLDDNSLTSWAWTLEGRDLVGIWVLQLAVLAAASALCRTTLPGRWQVPAVVSVAFAAGLSLAGEPEAVIDASRYFVQAKHAAVHGPAAFLRDWGGALPAWTDLPLAPLAYGLVFRLFGEHRLPQQVLTAALFGLAAFATARIGALLWGAATGARGAALMLAVPFLLVQVPLLLTDVPAMAAVTVAIWALLALLARGGAARFAGAASALGAALLVKYSTWVLLAGSVGLILLTELSRGRRAAAARGACAAAAGALAPALFALAKPDVVERQLALLSGFQWEGLRRWGESYASTFLFQAHPLLAAAAVFAVWQGWRARDRRVLVAAALPLVLVALGARRTRYLLPAIPLVALLAARGLEALPGRARRFAVLAAAGQSLVMVFAVHLPFLQWINTANLMAAGRYLDQRGVAAAAVWVQPAPGVTVNPDVAVPLLDYHTAARLLAPGPAPDPPPQSELLVSSFRFSWEQPLPCWYRADAVPAGAAHVLIGADADGAPPRELALRVGGRLPDAVFRRDAVFRYRTLVSIWLPRDGH